MISKLNISLSKVIENSISGFVLIVITTIVGAAIATIWTAVTEQQHNIDMAVSSLEAKLTAVIEVTEDELKAESALRLQLNERVQKMYAELTALHDHANVKLNRDYEIPEQNSFDPLHYQQSISDKHEYHQHKQ